MQHIHDLNITQVKELLRHCAARLEQEKTNVALLLKRAEVLVRENPSGVEDAVDIAYFCDRVSKETEAAGKEARRLLELLGQLACAAYITRTAGDPNASEQIPGYLAVGTVKMNATADIPPRDSDAYRQLMQHLGVANPDADVVRPHWPGLMAAVTEASEQGRPIPPGLDPRSVRVRYAIQNLRLKRA